MVGDVVALKHHQIGVFDVQFNRSDILDDQQSFGGQQFDDKLIFGWLGRS